MKQVFVLSIVALSLLSCSKDKDNLEPAPQSIEGYWMGTFNVTGRSGDYQMAVVLRPNGSARVLYGFENGDTTQALYITEDQFTYQDGQARFQSRQSSDIYAYVGNAHGSTISGTWGELPSYDDGGKWSMVKK